MYIPSESMPCNKNFHKLSEEPEVYFLSVDLINKVRITNKDKNSYSLMFLRAEHLIGRIIPAEIYLYKELICGKNLLISTFEFFTESMGYHRV